MHPGNLPDMIGKPRLPEAWYRECGLPIIGPHNFGKEQTNAS